MGRIFTGISVAAALIFLAAPVSAQLGLTAPPPQTPPAGKVLSSTGGRFVFGQISDSSKDQFMLDTRTGRLWRIGESGDVGTHLKAILYRDEHGKVSPCPGEVLEARPEETPDE